MEQDLDAELDDLELRKNLGIHPRWRDPAAVGQAAHAPLAAPANLQHLPGPPAMGAIPGAAAARAAKLASDAMALDLAQAAGDPAASRETVRLLLAHQVAAGHSLMMRLTAIADSYVNYVQPAAMRDPYLSRCPQEAVRLAHGAARLMERVRAAALALQRLGYPGTADPHPPAPQPRPPHVPENNPDPSSSRNSPPPAPAQMPHPARPAAALLRRGRLNNGNPPGDFLAAPRCGAATRAGHACRQPAMAGPRGGGGRCRFHGGKSTGPRSEDGLARARNARLVHGFRSGALIRLRRDAAQTCRELKRLTGEAKQGMNRKDAETQSRGGFSATCSIDLVQTDFGAARGRAHVSQAAERPFATGAAAQPLRAFASLRFNGLPCFPARGISLPVPAGHGVDRSDSSRPLDGAPVQSPAVAATTSGPSARACP